MKLGSPMNTILTQIVDDSDLESVVEATERELGLQRDTYRQDHTLPPNFGFPVHFHRETNEWIIVADTVIEFVFEDQRAVKTKQIKCINAAAILSVPQGMCHTIRNKTLQSMHYSVLKDGPDDFNFCHK